MVLAGSLILNSCKKKEDEEATPSKASMLAGTWKMTAFTCDPPYDLFGTPISDFFVFFQDCEKDDLLTVKSDKTYTFNEGATKCNTSDPDLKDTGTWLLSSDGKKVTIDSDSGDAEIYDLKSLTSSSMSISMMEYDSLNAKTYTYTQTFAKQ